MSTAQTMRAAVTTPDGFELRDVDRPVVGSNEVLIEVAAAGINPADWKRRAMPDVSDHGEIIGWDVAGTVVETGPGVTRFEVGHRVFGMPRFPELTGSLAQFVVARSRTVARVPDGVSSVDAGAIPLAGLTAWQALVDTMGLEFGERVLIHAASGGVGHLAVQIAKARGAEVWATASAANHDVVRELGADHLIDYRSQRFEDVATAMDGVLDLVGDGDTATRSLAVLAPGGRLVAISPQLPDPDDLAAAGVTAKFVLVEPDHAGLESLAALMASGALRVLIAEQRPLDAVGELFEIGQRGGPPGKLVAVVS